MNIVKAEEYPILVSAVERYVNEDKYADVDTICSILGICKKKNIDHDLKAISTSRADKTGDSK